MVILPSLLFCPYTKDTKIIYYLLIFYFTDMTTSSPSPSTYVEMEVPEVETPNWQPTIPITTCPYTPNLVHID